MDKSFGQIKELEKNIRNHVDDEIADKIMSGSNKLKPNSGKDKIACWVKDAMNRMDELVAEETRFQIMEACGVNCALVNKDHIDKVIAKRDNFNSIDEFLQAESNKPTPGTRLTREGNVLYQFYTPKQFSHPMRCYCGLLHGLPGDETISPTYCHCSKGFVKTFWEKVLGVPVKVDLEYSVMTGAEECKFKINF